MQRGRPTKQLPRYWIGLGNRPWRPQHISPPPGATYKLELPSQKQVGGGKRGRRHSPSAQPQSQSGRKRRNPVTQAGPEKRLRLEEMVFVRLETIRLPTLHWLNEDKADREGEMVVFRWSRRPKGLVYRLQYTGGAKKVGITTERGKLQGGHPGDSS